VGLFDLPSKGGNSMNLFNRLVSTALSAVASALRDPPPVRPAAPRPRAVLCVLCGTEIDVTGTRGPTRDVCDACRASRDAARQLVKRAAEAAKRPPRYDNPDNLLTVRDLCQLWNVAPETARRWLRKFGQSVKIVSYHGQPCHGVTESEAERIAVAASRDRSRSRPEPGDTIVSCPSSRSRMPQERPRNPAMPTDTDPDPKSVLGAIPPLSGEQIRKRYGMTPQTFTVLLTYGVLIPIPGTFPLCYTPESVARLDRIYKREEKQP
jgi:hypothetical protein